LKRLRLSERKIAARFFGLLDDDDCLSAQIIFHRMFKGDRVVAIIIMISTKGGGQDGDLD
jgi:hypothetical protein